MSRERSFKKLSLITVLSLLILISIVIAVKLPSKQAGSHGADVNLRQESLHSNQVVAENSEPIEADSQGQIPEEITDTSEKVIEENTEIVMTPSSEEEAKVARTDSNVSRGAINTNTASNTGSINTSDFWQNRKTWLQPVKGKQTADPTGGARYFGASRPNGRTPAGIDFIAPNGTLVYAITDGKVIRTSVFFENTSAVEVQNTDGTIARYCEIDPAVSLNTIVHRGDVIGKIIANYGGTSMLHLEMYMGTTTGRLSQSNTSNYKYVTVGNYQRRSDLIDPTGAKDLPIE
jgi:murein DD-endopeptidase MepM/ murein hydrolase activator NlpD